ncbi:MAG TPA: DUF6458 family protein, partial [Marmoricola sp.]|nr:DUF6458 family protein [Marmoricola sp.]
KARCPAVEGVGVVGGGLFLMVIGAIVAFAVDDEVPGLNLTVTGVILMLAGAVVVLHARQRERERDAERRRTLDIEEEAVVHTDSDVRRRLP